MHRLLTFILAATISASCAQRSLTIDMVSQNNSGQTGTATLSQEGDALVIDMVIKRANLPDGQPAHLHEGRCGEVGAARAPICGAMGTTTRDAGTVGCHMELTLFSLDSVRDGGWMLNVHDPRDFGLYTSCGNID